MMHDHNKKNAFMYNVYKVTNEILKRVINIYKDFNGLTNFSFRTEYGW